MGALTLTPPVLTIDTPGRVLFCDGGSDTDAPYTHRWYSWPGSVLWWGRWPWRPLYSPLILLAGFCSVMGAVTLMPPILTVDTPGWVLFCDGGDDPHAPCTHHWFSRLGSVLWLGPLSLFYDGGDHLHAPCTHRWFSWPGSVLWWGGDPDAPCTHHWSSWPGSVLWLGPDTLDIVCFSRARRPDRWSRRRGVWDRWPAASPDENNTLSVTSKNHIVCGLIRVFTQLSRRPMLYGNKLTRMHSSRMPTTRSLTPSRCIRRGGGGAEGMRARGMCMPGARHSLTVDRILDTRLWKHYLPATTVAGGKNTKAVKNDRPLSLLGVCKMDSLRVCMCVSVLKTSQK